MRGSSGQEGAGAGRWRARSRFTIHASLVALAALGRAPAQAQVAISPGTTHPAAWERFAVRVFGVGDTSVIGVRVDVPEAVQILAVEPVIGWSYAVQTATDTTPQAVAWMGGTLQGMDLQEFAVMGRVAGDARRKELVFPVHVTLAGGEVLHFAGSMAAARPAPRVQIIERTQLSSRGAMAAAAVAVALSVLALALTLSRRRTDDPTSGGMPR